MFGLPATTLIPAVLVFLAVAFGTISLALFVDIIEERRRRLSAMQALREFTNSPGAGEGPGLLRGIEGHVPDWLAPVAARVPAFEDAQLMLEQAGATMTLVRFIVISIGLCVALGVGVLVLTLMWPFAMIAAVLGALLPYMNVRR